MRETTESRRLRRERCGFFIAADFQIPKGASRALRSIRAVFGLGGPGASCAERFRFLFREVSVFEQIAHHAGDDGFGEFSVFGAEFGNSAKLGFRELPFLRDVLAGGG